MIITKQKDKKTILDYLKGDEKIFIAGCTQCATVCKTGGEDEVLSMKNFAPSNLPLHYEFFDI